MTNRLVILSAGDESRYDSNVPKSLFMIDNKTNLENTIETAKDLFSEIHVLVKIGSLDKYPKIDDVTYFEVESGCGDGHSLLTYFEQVENIEYTYEMCIAWGDTIFTDSDLMEEVRDTIVDFHHVMVIPVRFEKEPYVSFERSTWDGTVLSINFSKDGETKAEGYHDQSIFKITDVRNILYLLRSIKETMYNKQNHCYNTMNGELNLLRLYNRLPFYCYETDFETKSYNSLDDLRELGFDTEN